MSWANAIPLVTLLSVVFGAGIFVAELRAIRREFKAHQEADEKHFEAQKKDFEKDISELKAEVDSSSKDQGRRIGNLEAGQRVIEKVDDVRRELTGRHKIGRGDE
jgi:peptidoglycan hydrolase CwlO-like protein